MIYNRNSFNFVDPTEFYEYRVLFSQIDEVPGEIFFNYDEINAVKKYAKLNNLTSDTNPWVYKNKIKVLDLKLW